MTNNQGKISLLDKELTRRDFLKVSGKGIAGLAITATFLSLVGCGTQQELESKVESGELAVWAIPEGVLVAERARCVGCQRCETSCTLRRDGKVSAHLSRVKIRQATFFGNDGVDSGGGIYGDLNFNPVACRQCANPECGNVCPVDAIAISECNNSRVIDADKCVGCGLCANACPWKLPTLDPDTGKMTKCVNCSECVRCCPTGALRMLPWEDLR